MSPELKYNSKILLLAGGEKSALLEMLISTNENVCGLILPFSKAREVRYENLKAIALKNNIPISRPNRNEILKTLHSYTPELIISAGYPYLLNAEVLSYHCLKINIHPTLLPKYRGANSAWFVIANGECESGVTVHFIDEGIDTGAIINQQKVELSPFDTTNSLMRKTSEIEPNALKEALIRLRTEGFSPVKQNESLASIYSEKRIPDDSLVESTKTLKELYNFIRACDPDRFPAFFVLDNQKVGIKLFRLDKPDEETDLI